MFHRLCINDLSSTANQPLYKENCILMCNGEIYNYKEICKTENIKLDSNSDCEVIIYIYRKYGFKKMLNMLDGVFAIVLYDQVSNEVYIARDRIGVRPLFYIGTYRYNNYSLVCASEAKAIHKLIPGNIKQLQGGHYIHLTDNSFGMHNYYIRPEIVNSGLTIADFKDGIRTRLVQAVEKRLLSDRPVACFLSGGVDSSIICAIMARIYASKGEKIKTFSIGFEGSTDLKYARIVADYISSDHTEIKLNVEDIPERLDDIINATETFDITTVRASTGMYLISEYISKNMDHTVILSGEGSDEVFRGIFIFS